MIFECHTVINRLSRAKILPVNGNKYYDCTVYMYTLDKKYNYVKTGITNRCSLKGLNLTEKKVTH